MRSARNNNTSPANCSITCISIVQDRWKRTSILASLAVPSTSNLLAVIEIIDASVGTLHCIISDDLPISRSNNAAPKDQQFIS